jgi:putative membrane protein
VSETPQQDDRKAEHPYRRLSPLTPLVRSFLVVVVVLGSTWDDLLHGDVGPIGYVLLAVLVAGAVFGTASWLRTKYWIESDELRVDTGIVSRQSRRIRVDRLQGIDIVQPFVARLFGLAELKMDVAGGGDREGSLSYLTLRDAEDLRERLLTRRDAVRATRHGHEESTPVEPRHAPTPQRELARLDLATLVVSLLLSAEAVGFFTVALVLGIGFAAFGQLGALAGVLPVLIGFALTQLRKLSAFYDFTVLESDAGLQIRRGLFERSSQTITLARVQGVVVSEPLLWRTFGWAKLDVAVAGSRHHSDSNGRPSSSTVMPVAQRAVALSLARRLLADSGAPDPDEVDLTPPPDRARWIAPVTRRFMAGGLGAHLVVSRQGILNRRTHVVPHARVQSLRLHQGPWQRRLRLADLHVDSPPGPVTVVARHRDEGEARRLLGDELSASRRARQPRPTPAVESRPDGG